MPTSVYGKRRKRPMYYALSHTDNLFRKPSLEEFSAFITVAVGLTRKIKFHVSIQPDGRPLVEALPSRTKDQIVSRSDNPTKMSDRDREVHTSLAGDVAAKEALVIARRAGLLPRE